MTSQPRQQEHWGSRLGVILAVAGSAVGLGNFLRFPGQAAANGGGAFMIPYFIAFLILGVPICWAEWAMGRHGGTKGFNSAPFIYEAIGKHPFYKYMGVIGVLIPLVVYMYYVVIESWCLGYAVNYLFGMIDLGHDQSMYAEESKAFFSAFVGLGGDGSLLSQGLHPSLVFWIIVFSINFYLIYQGLTKGVEKFCKFAVPLMAVCAIIVLVRVLTLGTPNPDLPDNTVLNGLGFMWNPKAPEGGSAWYESLLNPQTWLAATGQIFFSLSVGFGIIINYASYLKKGDDVVLSGLTASSTNEFFEVCLGGMITIPAAFIFLGAAGAVGGTFGLGFNTLPVVFEYMPAGHFFGFLWFTMLFLAAITSSLSMLQPAIAYFDETLGLPRRASVAILGLISALGSFFVLYFSKDLAALDTMDFWVGTFLIFVLATFQVILFSWILGVDEGIKIAEEGAAMKLPRVFRFVIRYISPTYLLVIFIGWSIMNLPGYIDSLSKGGAPLLSLGVIFAIFLFLLLLANLGARKRRAEA